MKKGIIILTILILSITTYRVKAVTITQEVDQNGYTVIEQNTTNYALDGERFTINVQPSETVQSLMFSAKLNDSNLSGKDYVEIPLMVALPANYVVGETQGTGVVCSYWLQNTNGTWACGQFINVQSMTPVEHTGLFSVFNIGANVILEDNSKAYCTIQSNSLVCPIYKKKVKELWFEVLYRSNNLGDLKIAFDRNWMYYMKINETQTIVDSIENQTQEQIESQKVCTTNTYDNKTIKEVGSLNNNGTVNSSATGFGVTDYLEINNETIIKVVEPRPYGGSSFCFYTANKAVISCQGTGSLQRNEIVPVPNGSKYVRFTISKQDNVPIFEIKLCKNGNQAIIDADNNYNNNPSQDYGNETNATQNLQEAEDILMNNLDLNATQDMNITINPNASVFIWNVVDSLRTISTKIILLMTSLLSIGVIKLILNR